MNPMLRRMPKTKQQVQSVDLRDPLNSLPNDDRKALRDLGLTGARGSGGRQRKALPKNWRERVAALASRPHTQAELARALGVSLRTLEYHLADRRSELRDVYETARSLLHRKLISPIEAKALAGDVEEARWLLTRYWPEVYGPGAINAPRTNVSVNVQNNFQLPKPLSPAEYRKLFLPAIEGEAKQT